MKKTIAAMLLAALPVCCCKPASATEEDDSREIGRIVSSTGVAGCLEPTRSPVRSATLRFVVSKVRKASAIELVGGSDREEACAKEKLAYADFPEWSIGARVEHPLVSVTSQNDRPQKR